MVVGIHQLHYFPWLGYLHKMAMSDLFIILDDVQLTDNSYMFRHKMLCNNGTEKYISIPFVKKDYMQKKYRDLVLNTAVPWQRNHANFIRENYKKAPYYSEVWDIIQPIFEKDYATLCDVTKESVLLMREMLGIQTKIVYQSELPTVQGKKTDLVLELCQTVGADTYLSGNGARKYMDVDQFIQAGINVEFQRFSQPAYKQKNAETFIPGLCGLDMLFNIGIEGSRELLEMSIQGV